MGVSSSVPKLDRLRQVREARFLTQADLAERSGVSRQTINRLEQGEIEARFKTLRQLADALEVQPATLISLTLEEAFIMACEDLHWTREQLAEWLQVSERHFAELASESRPRTKLIRGPGGEPTAVPPPAGWVRDIAIKHGADIEKLRVVLGAI